MQVPPLASDEVTASVAPMLGPLLLLWGGVTDPQLLLFPTPVRVPARLSLLLPSVDLWGIRKELGDLVASHVPTRRRDHSMAVLPS